MKRASKASTDCYSSADRGLTVWSQNLRAWTLAPVLGLLARLGVSANGLTVLALLPLPERQQVQAEAVSGILEPFEIVVDATLWMVNFGDIPRF